MALPLPPLELRELVGATDPARRLMQQRPRPRRYIGVDLHRGMVQWCQDNLAPLADGFAFIHHDVHSPCLNPDPLRSRRAAPEPQGSSRLEP